MKRRGTIIGALAGGLVLLLASAASAASTYTVQEGDTLWAIANRHGVPVETLASANGLASPDLLHPGQRLIIPSAGTAQRRAVGTPAATAAAAKPPATIIHVVQPGDTVWAIASRHRVSVSAIVAANGLRNPDALQLGQRLVIPGGRASAPSPATTLPATRTSPQSATPARGVTWASTLVNSAARLVGIRYRWGGSTPRGFDCSGFITYVMRRMGVEVPRTTYAMYASGRPVPRDQLQVGDIVFFQTTRPGPSHAGIFIGNDQFIHAGSGFGRVTITSMDYRYYKPRYVGARRFH